MESNIACKNHRITEDVLFEWIYSLISVCPEFKNAFPSYLDIEMTIEQYLWDAGEYKLIVTHRMNDDDDDDGTFE